LIFLSETLPSVALTFFTANEARPTTGIMGFTAAATMSPYPKIVLITPEDSAVIALPLTAFAIFSTFVRVFSSKTLAISLKM
jgi:hypothetical protein